MIHVAPASNVEAEEWRTIDGFASKEESCTVTVSFTDAEEWRMHLRMALPLN